jgi:methylated-DNA-[protein]-cysteine S-methyltransferase
MKGMAAYRFTFFETLIGPCSVVWSERGIVGLHLPESDESKAVARLRRRFPNAEQGPPPADVENAIAAIGALLQGEPADLSGVALDLDRVPSFDRRVYEVARSIAPGATLTYGEIATRLGDRNAARAVGKALGANPFPIVVPCHRVVAAGGKLGGFSAPGGADTKRRLLALESAHAQGERTLFG